MVGGEARKNDERGTHRLVRGRGMIQHSSCRTCKVRLRESLFTMGERRWACEANHGSRRRTLVFESQKGSGVISLEVDKIAVDSRAQTNYLVGEIVDTVHGSSACALLRR